MLQEGSQAHLSHRREKNEQDESAWAKVPRSRQVPGEEAGETKNTSRAKIKRRHHNRTQRGTAGQHNRMFEEH